MYIILLLLQFDAVTAHSATNAVIPVVIVSAAGVVTADVSHIVGGGWRLSFS